MSAILGRIEYSDQLPDRCQFDHAFRELADYGPDGSATAYGDSHAFALRYFRIKPGEVVESTLMRDGRIFVADAVLDARAQLLSELGLPMAEAEGLSDADLIWRAYLKWGQACPTHLFGDFAFAVYTPDRQELFLARDHIGKRPLYWTRGDQSFAFSSDIAALLAFEDTDLSIDPKTLLRHMERGSRPQSKTLFRDVCFVNPGCSLVVGPEGQRETRWWDPHLIKTTHGRSAQHCVEALARLLQEVMQDHVATDRPLGTHLSGGIDSGTITALSAQILNSKGRSLVAAYSWAPAFSEAFPDQGEVDERHNITRICDTAGVRARFGTTDYQTLEAFHQRAFEKEGLADLSEEPGILQQAAQEGVRVMLSGWGGDEAFSTIATDYLPYCLKRFRFVEAYRVLKYMCGGRRNPKILLPVLYYYGVLPFLPDGLDRRLMHKRLSDLSTSFINPMFRASDPDLQSWCDRYLVRGSNPKTFLAQLHLFGHLAARADTWASWSSGHGIQYRYPLLDRRIMEFMLAVPNKFLFVDGVPRYLARQATKDLLPPNLMKYDTVNEQLRWKLRFDYWKALVASEKDGAFDAESTWLDMPALREAIRACPETPKKNGSLAFRQLSLSIRIWYLERRYRARPAPDDTPG